MKTQLEAAIAADDALTNGLDARIKDLKKRSEDLQAQLSSIGGPLGVVSFGLGTVAPLLPAIIAVASAICVLLTGRALRRMRLAIERSSTDDGRRLLRPWLDDAAGGSPKRAAGMAVTLLMAAWIWLVVRATGPLPTPHLSHAWIATLSLALIFGSRAWPTNAGSCACKSRWPATSS